MATSSSVARKRARCASICGLYLYAADIASRRDSAETGWPSDANAANAVSTAMLTRLHLLLVVVLSRIWRFEPRLLEHGSTGDPYTALLVAPFPSESGRKKLQASSRTLTPRANPAKQRLDSHSYRKRQLVKLNGHGTRALLPGGRSAGRAQWATRKRVIMS